MSLASVQDCKDYLRIQHTAEDTMLGAWLAQCVAAVENFIRRPITAELRTFYIDQDPYLVRSRLFVPVFPIAIADSTAGTADIVVTNADGVDLVQDIDFRFNRLTGELLALANGAVGAYFTGYPLTVVAYVGLSADPNYATRLEPLVNAALLDLMADRYQRRNPAATSEGDNGVSASYGPDGMPARVRDLLAPLIMVRAR